MADLMLAGIALTLLLAFILVAYAILSFFIRQSVRLMKLAIYGTVAAVAVIVLIAIAIVAIFLFL
jgi:hypothetical protein